MGYNPNNLIMIPSTPDTDKSFAVIKQELLENRNDQCRYENIFTHNRNLVETPVLPIMMANLPMRKLLWRAWHDVDFTKTMGIKMLQGKDFSGTPADSTSMILNKAAVDAMGLKNPIGMQMRYGRTYTVIGVSDNVIMDIAI